MSWLRPEGRQPSDYDPHKNVESFFKKHSQGKLIIDAFNKNDPFHVFYGDNVDEYLGYAERFMTQLGDKDLNTLTEQEVVELVRNSFHQEQIAKGFVQETDITSIAKQIFEQR